MAVVAVFLLALGLMGSAYVLSKGDYAPTVNVGSQPQEHAITASATSSQMVNPDLLEMQLRVQTDAKTAKQAVQNNAAVSADLRTKLEVVGLSDDEIQTASYNINEITESNYTCDKDGRNCYYKYYVTGYRVTNVYALKVTDTTKGGAIIDAASGAGVNQTFVDYVSFTLKDETRRALEKSRLKSAAAEAKAKAQNMAEGSGAELGKLLSLSEAYNYYAKSDRPSYALSEAVGSAAPMTDLAPGQVEVSVSVTASYEIS
jgi:hypothetical protein